MSDAKWTTLVKDLRAQAKRLVDRSEQLANNGEAHRSDIGLARGRELEGVAARIEQLLGSARPQTAVAATVRDAALHRLIRPCDLEGWFGRCPCGEDFEFESEWKEHEKAVRSL